MIEGGAPGFVAGSWTGILAPAGTPKEIIGRLNAGIDAGLNSPRCSRDSSSWPRRRDPVRLRISPPSSPTKPPNGPPWPSSAASSPIDAAGPEPGRHRTIEAPHEEDRTGERPIALPAESEA